MKSIQEGSDCIIISFFFGGGLGSGTPIKDPT